MLEPWRDAPELSKFTRGIENSVEMLGVKRSSKMFDAAVVLAVSTSLRSGVADNIYEYLDYKRSDVRRVVDELRSLGALKKMGPDRGWTGDKDLEKILAAFSSFFARKTPEPPPKSKQVPRPQVRSRPSKKPAPVVIPVVGGSLNSVSSKLRELHAEINSYAQKSPFSQGEWRQSRRLTLKEWGLVLRGLDAGLFAVMRVSRGGADLAIDLMKMPAAPGRSPEGVMALAQASIPASLLVSSTKTDPGDAQKEEWESAWELLFPLVFSEENRAKALVSGVYLNDDPKHYRRLFRVPAAEMAA